MTPRQQQLVRLLMRLGSSKKTIASIVNAAKLVVKYLKKVIAIIIDGIIMLVVDWGRKLVARVA